MVDVGVLDGVLVEEVVNHELDTPGLRGSWKLLRPDAVRLLDDGFTVLNDEAEVGVPLRKVETHAT